MKNEVSDLVAIFYSTILWRRASKEESGSDYFYFSCLVGGLLLRLPLPLRAGKADMINQIYVIMIGCLESFIIRSVILETICDIFLFSQIRLNGL
jgi:hypothetical protein